MKTLAILAVPALALGLAATGAQATDPSAAAPLPPTYVIHKLTEDGVQLRKLELERGGYEAWVEATDGSLVKFGVDPQTAELTDEYSHARARRPDGPVPQVNAAEAIQAVAATGYWDVREIEYEKGAWEVKARDDTGRKGKFKVDPVTGAVR